MSQQQEGEDGAACSEERGVLLSERPPTLSMISFS